MSIKLLKGNYNCSEVKNLTQDKYIYAVSDCKKGDILLILEEGVYLKVGNRERYKNSTFIATLIEPLKAIELLEAQRVKQEEV